MTNANSLEREKVKKLYDLIGQRRLYINTNFDIFSQPPQELLVSPAYNVPLAKEGSTSYNSTLLFSTLVSLLNHGTMLLTGGPGIGKTTSVEFASHFFTGVPLKDILEAEIIGNPQFIKRKTK